MKTETLKALKASIAHWKRMAKLPPSSRAHETPTADDCPLCWRFNPHQCELPDGERCPVYAATGEPGCIGSPCFEAASFFIDKNKKDWPAAAQKEIKFLESLLPKKGRKK